MKLVIKRNKALNQPICSGHSTNEDVHSKLGKLTKPGDCHMVGKNMLKLKQHINKSEDDKEQALHFRLGLFRVIQSLILCVGSSSVFAVMSANCSRMKAGVGGGLTCCIPFSQKLHSFPAHGLRTMCSCALSRFRAVYRDVHSSMAGNGSAPTLESQCPSSQWILTAACHSYWMTGPSSLGFSLCTCKMWEIRASMS